MEKSNKINQTQLLSLLSLVNNHFCMQITPDKDISHQSWCADVNTAALISCYEWKILLLSYYTQHLSPVNLWLITVFLLGNSQYLKDCRARKVAWHSSNDTLENLPLILWFIQKTAAAARNICRVQNKRVWIYIYITPDYKSEIHKNTRKL